MDYFVAWLQYNIVTVDSGKTTLLGEEHLDLSLLAPLCPFHFPLQFFSTASFLLISLLHHSSDLGLISLSFCFLISVYGYEATIQTANPNLSSLQELCSHFRYLMQYFWGQLS